MIMWGNIVTLYIDDTSIRLLVSRRQRIKKWADLQLEPGLVKGGVVVQEAEVASRIKQLLKSQKVRTKKVVLGYSGLHSLTRPVTLPQLPKSMLSEAVAREARRVLPVPLDQVYLSWRNLPCPKGRIQIFMAASPRRTADSLVKTLRQAGLEPSRMAIKPLALTKALDVNTAILVDVQTLEFDIAVMVNGVSQPIRTVALPNEEVTWEQKLAAITGELERTIKFYDTNNPERPLEAGIPIYVSGELINRPESQTTISQTTGHPVIVLPAILKGPEQIDLSRYMVNIAMSIRTAALGRESAFPASNLNLLPAPYQPRPISLTKVIGIPGGIALTGIIVPVLMMMQNSSTNIQAMENELDITNEVVNQKLTQKQELKKNIDDLQKQVNTVKAAYESFQQSADRIAQEQEIMIEDLLVVLTRVPSNITLYSVNASGGNVTVRGKAPQEDLVLSYARDLDLSGMFSSTTVSTVAISPPEDGSSQGFMEFTLTLKKKE
jgi:type IV pilus assembly protein PilM